MNPKHILVMQSGGWIGDMVMLSPGLRALHQKWPSAEISLFVRPLVADLMRPHPHVDRLLVYDKRGTHRGISSLLDWAQILRGHDLAVVWHPTSVRSALLPWLAKIPIRIGTRVSGRGVLLTHGCADRTDLHEIERYLSVLESIGIKDADPALYYWHTGEQRRSVTEWLRYQAIEPGQPLIAVHLNTTWPTKQWHVERFAEVIHTVAENGMGHVVLVGGKDNRVVVDKLNRHVSVPYTDAVGLCDLLELGALLENCALLLTCDSGPMHIAAAVGTPVVALFGPTSPQRHRPYGNSHVIVQKHVDCSPCYRRECPYAHECMQQIQVDDVLTALAQRLSDNQRELVLPWEVTL